MKDLEAFAGVLVYGVCRLLEVAAVLLLPVLAVGWLCNLVLWLAGV